MQVENMEWINGHYTIILYTYIYENVDVKPTAREQYMDEINARYRVIIIKSNDNN